MLFTISDLKWRLLPHVFNNLFILFGLAFSFFVTNGQVQTAGLFNSATNILMIGSVIFVLNQFFPYGLGGGDVKMIAGIASWLGLFKVFFALLMAFGFGAIFALPWLYSGKITRNSLIPFGPFLSLGSLIVWFFPEQINVITRLNP